MPPKAAGGAGQPLAFRPLNVKDALSYLDRVKVTFSDQTEVYDQFLTIMKEFKSHGIDTPGVIERVSTLFRGHPGLIQGFNTFLPPGFRIECSVSTPSEGAVTTITVTTPMGMTTRTQVDAASSGSTLGSTAAAPTGTSRATASGSRPATTSVPPGRSPLGANPKSAAPSASTGSMHISTLPQPPAPGSMAASTPIATPGAASVLSSANATSNVATGPPATSSAATSAAPSPASVSVGAAPETAARPPMEFNHAINYVNKIKNRFAGDPETYRAFLEILQTYQRDGKQIQDVYAQVTLLFHAAPDLLDEFKQFLPDTSAPPTSDGQSVAASAAAVGARNAQASGSAKRPATQAAQKIETSAAKKPKVSRAKVDDKGKAKRAAKPDPKDVRKAQQQAQLDGGVYSEAGEQLGYGSHMASGPAYPGYSYAPQPVVPVAYAYEAPPAPPPPQPILPVKPLASQADLAFFQRVKAHTSDTPTYHEFLKLLNLYTQDMIDLTALVSRASLFIGQDAQLWREFRDMVGWTEGRPIGDPGQRIEVVDGVRVIENVPTLDGPRGTATDDGKGYKTHGPSYRQLAKSEISLNCSGRDALCWEVLNDEWVSQPSWASDEGFIAHRKNSFEEALHRSEEERHEYDYYIEANLRTIALLEPIATRIAIMEADERTTFRLKPGLGNQSKSIYQRVIKQIYGKDQGLEVIQALHENPCVAVPIVLARLKQKDDEWKRALREWNRVWREADAKNYWKALDHQGILLKTNDKKVLTSKALVTEIETVKRAQRQRAAGLGRSAPDSAALTTQFSYEFPDGDVIFDAAKLLLSMLDRVTSFSNSEKDRIDTFLRQLLPMVFAFTPTEFALEMMPAGGGDADDLESMAGMSDAGSMSVADDGTDAGSSMYGSTTGGGGAASTRKGGKKAAADLRKKALKNAGGVPGAAVPASASGAAAGAKKGGASRSKVSSRGVSPAASESSTSTPANGLSNAGAAAEVSMTDPMPTVTSLSSLITPEVEAEIAAHRDAGNDQDSNAADSRETSVAAESPVLGSLSSMHNGAAATGGGALAAVSMDVDAGGETSAEGTPEPAALAAGSVAPLPEVMLPEVIVPVDDRPQRTDLRRQWNTFANSNLYCFIRLFQVLYSRLSMLKNSAVVVAQPPSVQPITEQHVPSLSLSLTMATLKEGDKMSHSAEQLYQRALGLCEKLFGGEIDQATFEECLRHMFATQGYMLFTIDKLLNSILKMSLASISDPRTREIVDLLRQDRAHPDRSTPAQQTFYRTQAESALGNDENLYRIEWIPERKTLAIQLLGKDSIATDDLATYEREWAAYLEAYVLGDPTPGVIVSKNDRPFLQRNLRKAAPEGTAEFPKNLLMKSALQSKVCMRSFRLFFVAGTEDELVRHQQSAPVSNPSIAKAKVERFNRFVEKRTQELLGLAAMQDEEAKLQAARVEQDKEAAKAAAAVIDEEAVAQKTEVVPASEGNAAPAVAVVKAEEETSKAAQLPSSAAATTDAASTAIEAAAPAANVPTTSTSAAAESSAISTAPETTTDSALAPASESQPAAAPASSTADEDVKMSDA